MKSMNSILSESTKIKQIKNFMTTLMLAGLCAISFAACESGDPTSDLGGGSIVEGLEHRDGSTFDFDHYASQGVESHMDTSGVETSIRIVNSNGALAFELDHDKDASPQTFREFCDTALLKRSTESANFCLDPQSGEIQIRSTTADYIWRGFGYEPGTTNLFWITVALTVELIDHEINSSGGSSNTTPGNSGNGSGFDSNKK